MTSLSVNAWYKTHSSFTGSVDWCPQPVEVQVNQQWSAWVTSQLRQTEANKTECWKIYHFFERASQCSWSLNLTETCSNSSCHVVIYTNCSHSCIEVNQLIYFASTDPWKWEVYWDRIERRAPLHKNADPTCGITMSAGTENSRISFSAFKPSCSGLFFHLCLFVELFLNSWGL